MAKTARRYDPAKTPAWSHVATLPGGFKVTVREELGRGRRLYLWWRVVDAKGKPNWAKRAAGEQQEFGYGLRDEAGQVRPDVERWAAVKAQQQCAILAGDPEALARAGSDAASAPPAILTLGATRALLTDADTGPYPHDTPHRRELLRQLDYMVSVFGQDRAWATIDRDAMTTLARRKLAAVAASKAGGGFRAAEVLIQRVSSIAVWLVENKRIPEGCGIPFSKWRRDLRDYWRGLTKAERDPAPSRPRHTVDEMRKLLAAAWDVDPRFGLMLAVGAELRLGQVRRAWRSDLALDRGSCGEFTVHGAGKKKGEVVELTHGQRAAVDRALRGVLAPFEDDYRASGTDYRLFPAGHLAARGSAEARLGKGRDPTRAVSREWITDQFHATERAAQVTPMPGRAAYGVRRVAVDGALGEGISQSGLQASGGWTDPSTPMAIYRENENRKGRAEARDVRAKVRGEEPTRTHDVHTSDVEGEASGTPELEEAAK